jgi:hypothetical protein
MISDEIKNQLIGINRGVAFPVDNEASPEIIVDEVGTFNLGSDVDDDGISKPVPPARSRCIWAARTSYDDEGNDYVLYGVPTVLECNFISVNAVEPNISTEVIDNEYVQIDGLYGFDTFPNISYAYKNSDTNEIIEGTGFPLPNNEYIKNLVKIGIDPLLNKDVEYTVDFLIEFNYGQIAFDSVDTLLTEDGGTLLQESNDPLGSNRTRIMLETSIREIDSYLESEIDPQTGGYLLYVDGPLIYRKDRFKFIHTVRNWTGERFSEMIQSALSLAEDN